MKQSSHLQAMLLAVATVAFYFLEPSTLADTITGTGWKGTTSTAWSNVGNWDSTAPSTGGSGDRNLFFGQGFIAAGGTGNTTANNDLVGWNGYRITFQDSNAAGNGTDGSSANDTAFTITGNSFTLFDFGGLYPRIENDSYLLQTFNLTSGQTLSLNGSGGGSKAEINAVNGDMTFSATTPVDLAGTTQLQIFGNNGKTLTFNGVISSSGGANGIVLSQNSTVILGAANTYSGGTTINSGVVRISADNNLGAVPGAATPGSLTINGGTLAITAGITLNSNRGIAIGGSGATIDTSTLNTSTTTTIGAIVAGTGALTIKSNGDLSASGGGAGGLGVDLRGVNTFNGDVTITAGLVAYLADSAFGAAGNKIILNGGGLVDPSRNLTLAHNIQVNAGGGTFRLYGGTTATYSGTITGSGNINRTDGGTLNLTGDLSGYSGIYNNQQSTTVLPALAGASVGGNWKVDGGTLNINGRTVSFVGGGGGTFQNGAASDSTATVNIAASQAYTYGGAITTPSTGKINLIINATSGGTASDISLTGANTFKGSITVNSTGFIDGVDSHGGILGINGDGALGDAANTLTLNNGGVLANMWSNGAGGGWGSHATFTLGAGRTINLTGAAGGVIRIGYGDTMTINSLISGAGSLAHVDGGVLILGNANTYLGTTISTAGTIRLSGGANRLPTGTTLLFNGSSTLDLNAQSQSIAGITLSDAGITGTLANGTLTTGSGTITFLGNTVSGATLAGGAIGITGGTIDASAVGTTSGMNRTVTTQITGTGGLFLKGNGDTSDNGGGNSSQFTINNTANNFTGGVTIQSRLVNFNNDSFGDAANTITINAGAGLLTSAGLTIASTHAIVLSGAGDHYFRLYGGKIMTINGVISDSGGAGNLRETDGGILILGGANTYTGTTIVGGGTLRLANSLALQNSTLTTGGIVFDSSVASHAFTFGGLSGSGGIALQDNAGVPNPVALTVGNNNASTAYSGALSAAGSLTKIGTGTLTLSGGSSYSGGTTINNGILSISSDGNLGAVPGAATPGNLTINGATLAITAGITLNANRGVAIGSSGATIDTSTLNNSTTATIGGIVAGTGALAIKSSGDLSNTGGGAPGLGVDLRGVNTFTGDITVTGGLVAYLADSAFGAAGNKIILNGGGLVDPSRNLTLAHNIQINAGGGVFRLYGGANATYTGAITGSGNITRTDGGSLNLSGDLSGFTGTYFNNAANTFFSNSSAGDAAAIWTINAGNLANVTAGNQSISLGALSGTGGQLGNNVGSSVVTYSIGALNSSTAYSGNIVDSVGGGGTTSIIKTGTGTLTLSGANKNYTGATTINSGVLSLQDTTGFASAINVGASGTLSLNRTALGFANRSAIAGNAITGSGTINANSSGAGLAGGWVIVNTASAMNFTGTVNVNSGVFGTDGAGGAGVIQGSATVNVATGAVFSNHSSAGVTIGGLNGSGDVTPAQSGGGTYMLTVGAGDQTGLFSGIIHGDNSTGATDGTMEAGFLALTKTGTGTQTLTGANTFTGTPSIGASVFINQGVLATDNIQLSGTASGLGKSGSIALLGGTMRYTGSGGTTDRRIELGTNNGSIDASGSGALTLTGSNGGAGQSGARTLTLTGSSTAANAISFGLVDAGGALALVKNGTGNWLLSSGATTYTGATSVNNGVLTLQDTTGFASAVGVGASGTLNLVRTSLGFANRDDIGGSAITGSGTINVNNSGSGLAGGWVTVRGGSALNFTGTLNVNSGVFATDAAGVVTGSATVNVAAGAVLSNHDSPGGFTIGGLNGTGDVTPAQSGGGTYNLTLGAGDKSGSFSGIIHGNNSTGGTDGSMEAGFLSLTKIGTGTQILSGANTYTGATTVSGGILNVSGGAIPATSGMVLGPTAGTSGTVQVNAGGSIIVSNPTVTAKIIVGDLGKGTFVLNSGTVTANSLIVTNNGNNNTFTFNGGRLNTSSTTVSNGAAFVVGNGTSAAVMNLLGGTHRFADGLLISSNGVVGLVNNTGTISAPSIINQQGGLLGIANSTAMLAANIANYGTVIIGSSSVIFGGDVLDAGTWITTDNPVNTFLAGLTIAGERTMFYTGDIVGGNLLVQPTGNYILQDGSFSTISGTATDSGNVTVNGGSLTATGGLAVQGTVNVQGGSVTVANPGGTANLSVTAGTVTQNGGIVSADSLTVTSGGSSPFISGVEFKAAQQAGAGPVGSYQFNAGTINTRNTYVSNGSQFVVGDGEQTARLNLVGGTHTFVNGLAVSSRSWLTGNGTINGDVTNSGAIAPGNSPGILTVNGNLTETASALLDFQVGGTAQGTQYDFMHVTGTAALNGTLALSFLDGFENSVTGNDVFTLLTADSGLTGAFINIGNGGRLTTLDGFGSFLVQYSGKNLVASSFRPAGFNAAAVPEPSTLMLVALGGLALWRARRR